MKASVKYQLIVEKYVELLNNHMIDLENGILDDKFSIKDFAKLLIIHPVKLSNTK